MKFTEHLAAHITPEWRKQYINYEVRFLTLELRLILMYAADQINAMILVSLF